MSLSAWQLALILALAWAAAVTPLRPVKEKVLTAEELKALKSYRKTLPHPEPYEPDHSTVVQLAWTPRAFLFPNFLSHAECDFIVNYSRPAMERSTVVGQKGGSAVDDIRTSYGTFLEKYSHPVIRRIEDRVASWTFLPLASIAEELQWVRDAALVCRRERAENQEAMQVLRYQDGQKYGAHHDYFQDESTKRTGPRYATVLMYLSDAEFGGETVFPHSEHDKSPKDDTWSECGKQGVAVKPRKGDALLFFSMNPDGTFDQASMHAGCPVIKGEKWSATKWIHSGAFDLPPRDPKVCKDDNALCPRWAAAGECSKNPKYMMGTGDLPSELGFCRKSCKVCRP